MIGKVENNKRSDRKGGKTIREVMGKVENNKRIDGKGGNFLSVGLDRILSNI